ncbi:hypothetical protein KM043_015334 [Ampulex compressa]|nr:hypothetical protein KM043_015334 [Ampulex compressa]
MDLHPPSWSFEGARLERRRRGGGKKKVREDSKKSHDFEIRATETPESRGFNCKWGRLSVPNVNSGELGSVDNIPERVVEVQSSEKVQSATRGGKARGAGGEAVGRDRADGGGDAG